MSTELTVHSQRTCIQPVEGTAMYLGDSFCFSLARSASQFEFTRMRVSYSLPSKKAYQSLHFKNMRDVPREVFASKLQLHALNFFRI